jgi:hypothetical protein
MFLIAVNSPWNCFRGFFGYLRSLEEQVRGTHGFHGTLL